MTPDIERAVDAMIRADGGEHWTLFWPRDFARNMVTAVLEALAEPSDAAVEAAAQKICLGMATAPTAAWEHQSEQWRQRCCDTGRAALRAANLAVLGRTE